MVIHYLLQRSRRSICVVHLSSVRLALTHFAYANWHGRCIRQEAKSTRHYFESCTRALGFSHRPMCQSNGETPTPYRLWESTSSGRSNGTLQEKMFFYLPQLCCPG